jgi:hypothetical protein
MPHCYVDWGLPAHAPHLMEVSYKGTESFLFPLVFDWCQNSHRKAVEKHATV